MTIDEALERLTQIMDSMEGDGLSLEESLAKFEEGIRLVKECQGMIDTAEKRIKVIEAQDDDV